MSIRDVCNIGAVALALAVAPMLEAQDTTAIKGYARRDTVDADSIARISTSPRVDRLSRRVKARQDSILAAMRKPDSVIVADTTTKPVPDSVVVVDTTTKPVPVDTTAPPLPGPGVSDLATLPRTRVDFVMPTGYSVVSVLAGANLQTALDAAACRTNLQLAKGATYTVNLVAKVKGCAEKMAVIVTTAGLTPLPRGQRITPGLSASRGQARVVTPNTTAAFITTPGSGGIYFEDVEITTTNTVAMNALVWLGTTQTTLAEVPKNFVFSHVYIHGTPTLYLRRCIYLNSAATAIVDSWVAECHENNTDSQAILMLNGPGPYHIENNYLEAGHEVIMSGGGDPSISGLIPSDIVIRRNHITRPVSWFGVWKQKNLVELKNAAYVLFEENVIENVKADAQVGYAVLFKSVNQGGTAPWSTTKHVTFRWNLVRNAGAGVNLCANCQNTVELANHFTFYDNLFLNINVAPFTGEAREWQFLGALSNVAITHNTSFSVNSGTSISLDGQPPKMARFQFGSNVYANGAYGIHAGTGGSGLTALTNAIDTVTMAYTYNAPLGLSGCTNAAPLLFRCFSSASALGMDNLGRWTGIVANQLPSHDGRAIGADAAVVYAKVAGVVVTDPSRPQGARRVATPRQSGYTPTSKADARKNTYGSQHVPETTP